MPSPEVIDLTLSDNEIQPDPIRSDQGTSMPTGATNRFRTSSSTPPPPPTSGMNRTRRILPVIQGTFAAIERAQNYLPLQPFFNNTHLGQTLINCTANEIHPKYALKKYRVQIACTLNKIYSPYRGHI